MDMSDGVATGICPPPTRGRTITSPGAGITPLFIGDTSVSEEKQIQYQTGLKEDMTQTGLSMYSLDSVDQALTNVLSLPQVLSQVTNKFKSHTQEYERLQQQTDKIQVVLTAEETKLQGMVDDIRSTERQIYLGQDQEDRIRQVCQLYQDDLEKLVKMMNQVQEQVTERETETEVIMSRIEKYEAKMMEHIQNTNVMDQDIQTFRQLRQQQESTEKLTTQKRQLEEDGESIKLLNGTAEAELRSAIGVMREAHKQIDANLQGKNLKIKNMKTRQKQLHMDTSVLHKRNAAQMTRLKRQVKEVRTSNKHWQEQTAHLEAAIQSLNSDDC